MKLFEVSKTVLAIIEVTYVLKPRPKYNWRWFGGIIFPKTREFINSLGFQKIDDYMDMKSESQLFKTSPLKEEYLFYIYNPKLVEQAESVKQYINDLHTQRLEAQPDFQEDLLEFKIAIKIKDQKDSKL